MNMGSHGCFNRALPVFIAWAGMVLGVAQAGNYEVTDTVVGSNLHNFAWAREQVNQAPGDSHTITFQEKGEFHVYEASGSLQGYTEIIGPSQAGNCTLRCALSFVKGGSIVDANIVDFNASGNMQRIWRCTITNDFYMPGYRVVEGIKNCDFSSVGGGVLSMELQNTEFDGCRLHAGRIIGTNLVILNSDLVNMWLYNCPNADISACTLQDVAAAGTNIVVRSSEIDRLDFGAISSRIESNRMWSVWIGGSNVVVRGNRVAATNVSARAGVPAGLPRASAGHERKTALGAISLWTNSCGIALYNAQDVTISDNYIGHYAGHAPLYNAQDYGILLWGARNVMIGGHRPSDGNCIGGNRTAGIFGQYGSGLVNNDNITILNNYIGLGEDGTNAVPNGYGIRFERSDESLQAYPCLVNSRIGMSGMGNLISGNTNDGVSIRGCCSNVVIQGNFIGMDVNGVTAIPNKRHGIYAEGYSVDCPAANIVIGADWGETDEEAGNVIAGNRSNGVHLAGATLGARMAANWIGLAPAGAFALPNAGWGVVLAGAINSYVGVTGTYPNVISGNGLGGVWVGFSTSNTIWNNFIGTGPDGEGDRPNDGPGVCLEEAAQYNIVGGSFMRSANFIGGNEGWGVYLPSRMGVSSATRNTICGNWIGIAPSGMTYGVNAEGGALIAGMLENRFGGAQPEEANIVDGVVGVGMYGLAAYGMGLRNRVDGNIIGFNPFTTFVSTTMVTGIEIQNSLDSYVGVLRGNAIGGASYAGIHVNNSWLLRDYAVGHYILNNVIGCATNAAGMVITNADYGILMEYAGDTRVGLTNQPNFIAGNRVGIASFASIDCQVQANLVGWDPAGRLLGNRGQGVFFEGDEYLIFGGATSTAYNVIGGSGSNALALYSLPDGQILGNSIGLALDGLSAATNKGHGILVETCTNVFIGMGFGRAPVIAGNAGDGIHIQGALPPTACEGAKVLGCLIGLNKTGAGAVPNGGAGVRIVNTASNVIGAGLAGVGNFIGGNLGDGMVIEGPLSQGNVVMGNYVGFKTDFTALGNQGHGIRITNAPGNIVGGLIVSNGNAIGHNAGCGALIEGATAQQNVFMGNTVGTTLSGGNHGNQQDGIRLVGTPFNMIGFTNEAYGNVIVHNAGHGVAALESTDFIIIGNQIGVSMDKATVLGNSHCGILYTNSRLSQIVNNCIGGNGAAGIQLAGPASDQNQIIHNMIGTSDINGQDLANAGDGVHLRGGDRNRIVGANVIARNNGNGVAIWTGSRISVMNNRIYANALQSIFLATNAPSATNQPNEGIKAPVIMSVTATNQTVAGMIVGKPSRLYLLDFYFAYQTNQYGAWAHVPLGQGAGMTGPDGIGGFNSVMTGFEPFTNGVYLTVNMTETNTEFLSSSSEFAAPFLAGNPPVPQPVPVVAVMPLGPPTAVVNAEVAFAAAWMPTNATPPLAFTWSPPPAAGQGLTPATFRFDAVGVWTVRVVAANFAGSATGETTIVVSAAPIPTGTVVAVLQPPGAVSDGARWRLAGLADTNWLASGAACTAPVGSYTQVFLALDGWQSPALQPVTLSAGATTNTAATYVVAVVPPAPAWIQATTGTQAGYVDVSWAPVNKAAAYLLLRGVDTNRAHATPLGGPLAATTYRDGSASLTNHYWYWVGATNAVGPSVGEAGPAEGWPGAFAASLDWLILLQE